MSNAFLKIPYNISKKKKKSKQKTVISNKYSSIEWVDFNEWMKNLLHTWEELVVLVVFRALDCEHSRLSEDIASWNQCVCQVISPCEKHPAH